MNVVVTTSVFGIPDTDVEYFDSFDTLMNEKASDKEKRFFSRTKFTNHWCNAHVTIFLI